MNEDLKLLLADEEAPKSVDPIETIISPISRSRRLVLIAGVVGASLGVLMGLLKPNQYQSTGKLLIHAGARESATPESTITENGSAESNNRDAVNNEVHLLNDPDVFRRTALRVGPAKILKPYDPSEHDNEYTTLTTRVMHDLQSMWFSGDSDAGHELDNCEGCVRLATKVLMAGVRIQAEPYSSIIAISYGTHSPKLAQEVVTAFIEAADEHHRETFASDSSLQFLESQVDSALAESTNADQDLTGFRISCGVYDLSEQRDNLLTVSHGLEQQIARDENRLTELNTLIGYISEELTLTKPTLEVVDSGGLRPEVGGGTRLTQVNPRWERLNARLDESTIERASLSSLFKEKRERLEEAQAKLIKLEECEPQHRLLEIDANRQRERATRFLEAFDRADLLNLLDQVEMSNLRVIQAATYPLGKIGPLRSKMVFIGLALGLALGIAIAFALHIFDRRLRNPNDLASILAMPVLATIPDAAPLKVKKPERPLPPGRFPSRVSPLVSPRKTG